MKAVLVHRPGGPEALQYLDLPQPELGETEVLIRAETFGVGQPDKLIRSGVYKWMPPLPALAAGSLGPPANAGVGSSTVLTSATGTARRANTTSSPFAGTRAVSSQLLTPSRSRQAMTYDVSGREPAEVHVLDVVEDFLYDVKPGLRA